MGANSTTEPTVTTAATATGANETSMPSKEAVNVVHDLAAPATKASAPVTVSAFPPPAPAHNPDRRAPRSPAIRDACSSPTPHL